MALKHAEPAPALAIDAASGWPGGPGGRDRSELKRRIWFTLGALIVFRIGTYIPIPGLDPTAVRESLLWGDVIHIFDTGPPWHSSSDALRIVDVFSGGGIERMAIFALSVVPYLSALMIMHMAAAVWPAIGGWKTGGETGRKKLRRSIRYGTLFPWVISSFAMTGVGLVIIVLTALDLLAAINWRHSTGQPWSPPVARRPAASGCDQNHIRQSPDRHTLSAASGISKTPIESESEGRSEPLPRPAPRPRRGTSGL